MDNRYELKTGDFGLFFHDKEKDKAVSLPEVLEILNESEGLVELSKETKKIKKHAEKIIELLGDDEL